VIAVLERDARCKMITIDPDTGEANRQVLRKVAVAHEGMAGIYAAVLIEGVVRQGDAIEIVEEQGKSDARSRLSACGCRASRHLSRFPGRGRDRLGCRGTRCRRVDPLLG